MAGGGFLRGYLGTVDGTPIVPANREHVRRLLDTLLLDKAAYELGYELNNRPDWVDIPLRGLLLATTDTDEAAFLISLPTGTRPCLRASPQAASRRAGLCATAKS